MEAETNMIGFHLWFLGFSKNNKNKSNKKKSDEWKNTSTNCFEESLWIM